MSNKRVYFFGGKEAEGNGSMRNLLGGKGANLAEPNAARSITIWDASIPQNSKRKSMTLSHAQKA